MKKLLSVLFSVALLVLALCVPASASGDPVVFDGINKISYEGRTYVVFPRSYEIEVLDENTWDYMNCEFEDKTTEALYDYFDAYSYENCDYALWVDYCVRKSGVSTSLFYIEESYVDSINALVDGTLAASGYKFQSESQQTKELPSDVMNIWVNEENRVQLDDYERGRYLNTMRCELYATDSSGFFGVPVGCVYLENPYNDGQAYLVMYNEYETNDFYADGTFAIREVDELWCYRLLNDDAYKKQLNEFSVYYPDEVYVDTFDTTTSEEVIAVFSVLLFAVAPFVVMVIAAASLIRRRKEKRSPYTLPLWMLIGAAAVIIICYAVVMAIIL